MILSVEWRLWISHQLQCIISKSPKTWRNLCVQGTRPKISISYCDLQALRQHYHRNPCMGSGTLAEITICEYIYVYIYICIDIYMYMYILVLTLCLVYCYLQYMTLIGLKISEMVSPVNCYFSYPAMLVSILFLGCFFNHMQNTEQWSTLLL